MKSQWHRQFKSIKMTIRLISLLCQMINRPITNIRKKLEYTYMMHYTPVQEIYIFCKIIIDNETCDEFKSQVVNLVRREQNNCCSKFQTSFSQIAKVSSKY